jgi:hypothetical protein
LDIIFVVSLKSVTHFPRKIMEMPSGSWEDVADNWFSGCCTSFGGAGEKLVAQFINAYGRLEGTSLLDTTAITIETDYLEADLVAQVACSASSDFGPQVP